MYSFSPHSRVCRGAGLRGGAGSPIPAAQAAARGSGCLLTGPSRSYRSFFGGGRNRMRSISANENGMHVCASVGDWQGCRLLATARALAASAGMSGALGAWLFLSGRHLGNDHGKCNHGWMGGWGRGRGRAENDSRMFYLFVQSHGHPIVCPSPRLSSPAAPAHPPAPAPLSAPQAERSSGLL